MQVSDLGSDQQSHLFSKNLDNEISHEHETI
jgi:hypothetical protein